MPTSSQALISHKLESNQACRFPVQGSRSGFVAKSPAPYSIALVYNLSGCFPLSKTSLNDYQAVKALGRESAQLFKYYSLPKGYTSILSFDESIQSFRWLALGGSAAAATDEPKYSVSSSDLPNSLSSSDAESAPAQRPHSSFDFHSENSKQRYVSPEIYDQLVGLGFRPSTLALKDGTTPNRKQAKRTKSVPNDVSRTKKKPLHIPLPTADLEVVNKENSQIRQPETADDSDEDFSLSPPDDDTPKEFARILPSIHMRKDTPASRPMAVIFSFRDNESSSHAEVKYLFETQVGVRVRSVQYDPLDVRACKPGISSRWIVEFNTKADVDKVIKRGLIIGRDKIIIYRHDDIAKREVATFKYFTTVKDAHKKLRGSQSLKKIVNGVKVINKLRNCKSKA